MLIVIKCLTVVWTRRRRKLLLSLEVAQAVSLLRFGKKFIVAFNETVNDSWNICFFVVEQSLIAFLQVCSALYWVLYFYICNPLRFPSAAIGFGSLEK